MRTRLLMWLTRTCASARLCDGLVALLLLMTPAAFAQDVEDEITRRNDQAIELSRSGKLADAIRIWFELLDTTPADYSHRWVFHKNVGRNFQKLESHDRAWWHLDKARQSPDGEKSDQVKQWLAEEDAFLTKSGWVKVHLAAIGTGEFMPVSDELSRWYPLPSDWWFRPGLYQLPVRGAPGKEATADFTVHPGTVQLMLDVPQAPGTGTVLVVADQALAAIRIDDRPAGLGRAEVELEPGSHRVQVSLEGFLNWEKTLDVKEGERIEEAVRLQPVPPPVVAIEKGEDEGEET